MLSTKISPAARVPVLVELSKIPRSLISKPPTIVALNWIIAPCGAAPSWMFADIGPVFSDKPLRIGFTVPVPPRRIEVAPVAGISAEATTPI